MAANPSRKGEYERRKRRRRRRSKGRSPGPVLGGVQYAAFRVGVRLLTLLPVGLAYRLARGCGTLGYLLDPRHRKVALRNLDLAYGDALCPGEKRALVKEAFQNLAMVGLDVIHGPRLLRRETLERHFTFENLEEADEAKARRGSLIYVTGHYGSWEAVSSAMALWGHPFHAVARPLANPRINAYVLGSREALGQRIIAKYGAMSELVRCLRAGESLGFVADQDARRSGIFVDFFGKKASTSPSPALLAVKFRIPIVVGYARRIGAAYRFRCGVTGVLWPDASLPRPEAVRRLTEEMNRCMEGFIRQEPGQYLWLHRRWKTRPEKAKRK